VKKSTEKQKRSKDITEKAASCKRGKALREWTAQDHPLKTDPCWSPCNRLKIDQKSSQLWYRQNPTLGAFKSSLEKPCLNIIQLPLILSFRLGTEEALDNRNKIPLLG
jgi:hypothetical protein